MNFQIYKGGQAHLIDDNSNVTFFSLKGLFIDFCTFQFEPAGVGKQLNYNNKKENPVCFPSGLWSLMMSSLLSWAQAGGARVLRDNMKRSAERNSYYFLSFILFVYSSRAALKFVLLLCFSSGT